MLPYRVDKGAIHPLTWAHRHLCNMYIQNICFLYLTAVSRFGVNLKDEGESDLTCFFKLFSTTFVVHVLLLALKMFESTFINMNFINVKRYKILREREMCPVCQLEFAWIPQKKPVTSLCFRLVLTL